ncbi:3'(2'),5'-bisphosphate nucleotidase CysQ [Sphingomonas rosea]|uniref:3'(2'),5'-bisphosphate nucleotidase CysQ n=1 Tax=Sphingomonas rosea TaxID=335605 RepID=A0ABP7TJ30_9SPHN
MDRTALLEAVIDASWRAGALIRDIRRRGCGHRLKSDLSPVTEADEAAEALILKALRAAAPDIPVVAEEQAASGHVRDLREVWFHVDPLDGTKEFIRGGDDYTVNVGLVTRDGPLLGVVLAPEQERLFAGIVGEGAFEEHGGRRTPLAVIPPRDPLIVAASKSHFNRQTEDYLAHAAPAAERLSIGSSLKFCLLATGEADFYPRLSPTSEWDTAAGHAVLLAAGGRVDGPDGHALTYGKPGFLNSGFTATTGWQAPPVGPWLAA